MLENKNQYSIQIYSQSIWKRVTSNGQILRKKWNSFADRFAFEIDLVRILQLIKILFHCQKKIFQGKKCNDLFVNRFKNDEFSHLFLKRKKAMKINWFEKKSNFFVILDLTRRLFCLLWTFSEFLIFNVSKQKSTKNLGFISLQWRLRILKLQQTNKHLEQKKSVKSTFIFCLILDLFSRMKTQRKLIC